MLALTDTTAAELFRPRTRIDADGTVEGYASLFGEIDSARDMVMPGAFRETLRLRGPRRIPMLFQHDPAEPVGVWLELREDHRGLYARGKLIPEVARARELYALVAAGAIDGLSIGFRTVKGRVDPRSRIRKLDQVELWEISIVTFPLLAGARVRAVKEAEVPSRPKLSSPLHPSAACGGGQGGGHAGARGAEMADGRAACPAESADRAGRNRRRAAPARGDPSCRCASAPPCATAARSHPRLDQRAGRAAFHQSLNSQPNEDHPWTWTSTTARRNPRPASPTATGSPPTTR
jgi:HK97 family phage prohead protease